MHWIAGNTTNNSADGAVCNCFRDDNSRMCAPTKYAAAQGAFLDDSDTVDSAGACFWRLRSPGTDSWGAAVVLDDGFVHDCGRGICFDDTCVRPAARVMS